jgi:predicted restriction endonuclease
LPSALRLQTLPDGPALCVLHHKTFDLGAVSVDNSVLLVSDQANGTTGFRRVQLDPARLHLVRPR